MAYKLTKQAQAAERSWAGGPAPLRVVPKAQPEQRMITEFPGIDTPGADLLSVFGLSSVALPSVTVASALQVPAFGCAVAFLSRSMASLPLHAFRDKSGEPEKIKGGIATIIHDAPNAEWTSFKLRQYFWQQVFTIGRGLLWIERSGTNVIGLYPMCPTRTTVERDSFGRTTYTLDGRKIPASDVIDVPFMLKSDGLHVYSPVFLGAKALQLALAMGDYGSRFFAGGGMPPLALSGPMPAGPEAMKRAMAEIGRAIDTAKASDKPLFPIPPGYELKQVGYDPAKGQMTEARRFQVEEVARILQVPPAFLQDLSHGTFSNVEQQDLNLVKHLIGQWAEAFEQEANLKLFGQKNNNRYVQHNLDGLMRGDFVTRMQGLSQGITSGILTPDEARGLENRPAKGGNADKLFIQGATVPIDTQNGLNPDAQTQPTTTTTDNQSQDGTDNAA